jgi:hypothetical protein
MPMKDQRITERRHDFEAAQTFPFTDIAGRIIHRNRRSTPDRRLNNICLEVVRLQAVDTGRERCH